MFGRRESGTTESIDHARDRAATHANAFAEIGRPISSYREIGIGHIDCLMNFGGPECQVADRSIRLFGERVMPSFA